jgi:hypothetical protein
MYTVQRMARGVEVFKKASNPRVPLSFRFTCWAKTERSVAFRVPLSVSLVCMGNYRRILTPSLARPPTPAIQVLGRSRRKSELCNTMF